MVLTQLWQRAVSGSKKTENGVPGSNLFLSPVPRGLQFRDLNSAHCGTEGSISAVRLLASLKVLHHRPNFFLHSVNLLECVDFFTTLVLPYMLVGLIPVLEPV